MNAKHEYYGFIQVKLQFANSIQETQIKYMNGHQTNFFLECLLLLQEKEKNKNHIRKDWFTLVHQIVEKQCEIRGVPFHERRKKAILNGVRFRIHEFKQKFLNKNK